MVWNWFPRFTDVARAFLAQGAAHIIWAITFILGLAPKSWVAYVIEGLPDWFTPYRLRIFLLGFAIISFLILLRLSSKQVHASTVSQERLDTEETKPISQSQTIPLNEFLQSAEGSGWQFAADNSFDIFHFTSALRDAGSTGEIQFWGREVQHIQDHTRDKALTEIGAGMWKGALIRPLSCIEDSSDGTTRVVSDNYRTTVEREALQGDLRKDIHLNKAQALNWLSSTQTLYQRRRRWSPSASCINRLRGCKEYGQFVEITRHDKHSYPVGQRLEDVFNNAGWEVEFDQDIHDVGSPHYVVGIEVQGVSELLVNSVCSALEQDGLPQISRNVNRNTFPDRRQIRIRVGIEDGNR